MPRKFEKKYLLTILIIPFVKTYQNKCTHKILFICWSWFKTKMICVRNRDQVGLGTLVSYFWFMWHIQYFLYVYLAHRIQWPIPKPTNPEIRFFYFCKFGFRKYCVNGIQLQIDFGPIIHSRIRTCQLKKLYLSKNKD